MDSILEKVTLYDVLGYLVPGSLVVLAACGKFLIIDGDGIAKIYENYAGFIIYSFVIVSFVCGILLSEVCKCFLDICKKIRESDKKFIKWFKATFKIKKDSVAERTKTEEIVFPVPDEIIIEALENAGLIAHHDGEININRYLMQMYSDIQSDKNYKRIHNYASAEAMYKNLALAVLISGIIVGTYWGNDICHIAAGAVAGGAGAIIFFHRYIRFGHKKCGYTVCWYVEKYIEKKGRTQ